MIDREINGLLSEWGRYVCRQNDMGLGFPREAPFSKERVSGSRSTETYIEHTDPEILLVDKIVHKMLPATHKVVILVHYIGRGPLKVRISQMGMSERRYFEYLRHAQEVIASLLDSMKEETTAQ
jgi:hypothetical protein